MLTRKIIKKYLTGVILEIIEISYNSNPNDFKSLEDYQNHILLKYNERRKKLND